MKIFKKQPLVPLILGILLTTYSLLAYFANIDFLNITSTVGNIIVSIGLILFAIFIVWPDINKKNIKVFKVVEFVLILFAAIVGFLLPAFNVDTMNLGTGSLWFGIALVLNGGLDLYFGVFNKKSLNLLWFFIHLFSVIIGTYLYATNYVDRNLELISFLTLLILGLYLIIISLLYRKK